MDKVAAAALAVQLDYVSCLRVNVNTQELVREHIVSNRDRVRRRMRLGGGDPIASTGQCRHFAQQQRQLTAAEPLRWDRVAVTRGDGIACG